MSWHRHRWTLVGMRVGHAADTGSVFTVVLYRCERCPKLRTDELTGRWTLDDFA